MVLADCATAANDRLESTGKKGTASLSLSPPAKLPTLGVASAATLPNVGAAWDALPKVGVADATLPKVGAALAVAPPKTVAALFAKEPKEGALDAAKPKGVAALELTFLLGSAVFEFANEELSPLAAAPKLKLLFTAGPPKRD